MELIVVSIFCFVNINVTAVLFSHPRQCFCFRRVITVVHFCLCRHNFVHCASLIFEMLVMLLKINSSTNYFSFVNIIMSTVPASLLRYCLQFPNKYCTFFLLFQHSSDHCASLTFEMSMPSKIQLLMTLNVAGGGKTAAPPFDVDGGSVSESCSSDVDTPATAEISQSVCHFQIILDTD